MSQRSALRLLLAGLAASVVVNVPAGAQANEIPGTDVKLAVMAHTVAMGREGTYPDGVNGFAISTTACNVGTVKVPWQAAMLENHPFITFLFARESNGRLVQISDYSYVKHGFYALTDDYCATCQEGATGGGTVLGLGCSDTYNVVHNGSQYWLGPPQEIDPWLGEWNAPCSHFDRGEPAVNPPQDCDGFRSLSSAMADALDPVGHRVRIDDAELQVPGNYFYMGNYVIRGEPEANRVNNMSSRQFVPVWSGTQWQASSLAGSLQGTVLQRWGGATLASGKNGSDDGRVYVAVKVSGPVNGFYHYEYALHNRDNARGVSSFSVPLCPDARVKNFGFHDPDEDSGNDWTLSVAGGAVTVSTTSNPLSWNTIHNIWFDSDAAPLSRQATLTAFSPGGGAPGFSVTTQTPSSLPNVYLGPGCADDGTISDLFATGNPAQATLGNPSFGLGSSGNAPGQIHLLFASGIDGALALGGGCTQWFGGTLGSGAIQVAATACDSGGLASYPLPVPSVPSFEGLHLNFQAAALNPSGGPLAGIFELTDGLRVRLGNSIPACP